MKKGLVRILSLILAASMISTAVTVQPFAAEGQYVSENLDALADISITKAGGWKESAYIEWNEVSGAKKYVVSVRKAGEQSYTEIDDELIRKYPSYWRADAVGLAAGTYQMRVVAYDGSGKIIASGETGGLSVIAYERQGFAFSPDSKYKSGSGAYNDDGTLKKDAKVIYITKDTASKCEAVIVTGNKGATTSCKGFQSIIDAKQKGYDKTPIDFRIIGTIELSDLDHISSSAEGLQIKGNNSYDELNITIEGIGEDATIRGFGMLLRNAGNVELRNFAVMLCMDDSISIDTDNCNLWIHNLDLFYGKAGGASDQAKGDGTIDVKGDSQYVTVSYNHLWDSGKSSLCGMTSESGPNYITYHHNWFDHSDSRHPRIRTMSVHVYNNYFDGNAKYGIGAAKDSSAFVESNVFRSCKHPMLSSKQGSDIMENDKTGVPDFSAKGTFSGENGGIIKAFNNEISGSDANKYSDKAETAREPVYYDANDTRTNGASTQFDAYLAKTRDEEVPSSVKALVGGKSYDNNGLAVSKLCAVPEDVSTVKATVTKYAGRINGGDFPTDRTKYSILNDDSNYSVDTALKADLGTYKTSLISIGGGDLSGEIEKPTETPTINPDDTTVTTTEKPVETTTTTEKVTETTTQAPVKGDVNGDRKVDGADAKAVLQAALNGDSVLGKMSYDIDGDNVIAAEDAALIVGIYSENVTGETTETTETTTEDEFNIVIKEYDFEDSDGDIPKGFVDENTPYYTLKNDTGSVDESKIRVEYVGGQAFIKDDDGNETINFMTPFPGQTKGIVKISADVTPMEAHSKWTLVQLIGEKTGAEVPEKEILGIRTTDDGKNYGYRVNGGTSVTSLKIANKDSAKVHIDFIIDIAKKAGTIIISDTAGNKTETKEITGLDFDVLTQVKFTTATKSGYSMYVENIRVAKKDDGSVDESTESTSATESSSTESTSATESSSTESTTTTESTTEGTTAVIAEYNFDGMSGDAQEGYTDNSTPYYTKKLGEDKTDYDGTIKVSYNGSQAYVQDDDKNGTLTFTVPFDKIAEGIVRVSADVTPTAAAGKWTLVQLYGEKTIIAEGEETVKDTEILGIRTASSTKYGYRVNGGSTVTEIDIAHGANAKVNVEFIVNTVKKTGKIIMTDSSGKVVETAELTRLDFDGVTSIRFVTATGTRSIYVDNVKIVKQ